MLTDDDFQRSALKIGVSPSSDKFARDLATLLASISKGLDNGVVKQLASLRDRLVEMNRNRLVKIN
ncbi:MAG: hypothetical protein ACE5IB_06880, partial [Candidatus Geothermarchaeales archaeon]